MKEAAGKFRKVLFWSHLVSGLVIGLVILTMAVTGMLLAFDPQIVEIAEQNIRQVDVPENGAQRLKLDRLAELASAEKDGSVPESVSIEADPESTVYVGFGRGKGVLFLNPYSGEVLGGISTAHEFMHVVENIHRRLGVRGKGEHVTRIANLLFLFMLISGLYLWWPKQWTTKTLRAVALFNPKARKRARDWNWHNVIGLWCAPLILVTTLTGLVMSYDWANDLLFRAAGSEPPVRMERSNEGASRKENTDREENQASFEQLFRNASLQAGEWQAMTIRRSGSGPVSVSIRPKDAPHRFARSRMKLDRQTGTVIEWEPYAGQSAGARLRSWIRPLHTGEAWGLAGQILAFTGALGAVMLVWSGFSLAWRRFFSAGGEKLRYHINPAALDEGQPAGLK